MNDRQEYMSTQFMGNRERRIEEGWNYKKRLEWVAQI